MNRGGREEVASFTAHYVFALEEMSAKVNDVVDGVWVRRWKDKAKGIIRSRCCGRGFLDRQKTTIDRHSSTASRLSHKLLCSLAMQLDMELEAWDISSAFLQGLKFSEIAKRAGELGHEVRAERRVWFRPPANVRRTRTLPST